MLATVSLLTGSRRSRARARFALVGTGCRGLRGRHDGHLHRQGRADRRGDTYWQDHYTKKYSSYVNGVWTSVYLKEREADPPGYFTGSSHVVSAKGKRSSLLAPFKKAARLPEPGSSRGRTSSAGRCSSSSRGRTAPTRSAFRSRQDGSRVPDRGRDRDVHHHREARKRGDAPRRRALSPRQPKGAKAERDLCLIRGLDGGELARRGDRRVHSRRRARARANRLHLRVKASATLDGYVFAPAGSKSVPAGATGVRRRCYHQRRVGCGSDNNFFLVVTYAGPATKATGGFFGPVSTNINASVKAGKNLFLLGANLPNGSYSLKLGFASGAAPFGGNVFLQRSC